ncbi:hypothetical protein VNI00_017893, partial [Paramarasmius palmivorus]
MDSLSVSAPRTATVNVTTSALVHYPLAAQVLGVVEIKLVQKATLAHADSASQIQLLTLSNAQKRETIVFSATRTG